MTDRVIALSLDALLLLAAIAIVLLWPAAGLVDTEISSFKLWNSSTDDPITGFFVGEAMIDIIVDQRAFRAGDRHFDGMELLDDMNARPC